MINHLVIFKFRPEINEDDIFNVAHQLGRLKDKIPTLNSFSFGKNLSPEQLNQGYTHAFVMTFDDREGWDIYLNHPEHKKIAQNLLLPMLENGLESVLVIDFES